MDWLTFISEIVKACAWPIAVIVIVAFLKKPLTKLLQEVIRFKWKDLEIEFDKEIRQIKTQAEKHLPPPTIKITTGDTIVVGTGEGASISEGQSAFLRLAELYPAAAILQAWLVLENSLREAAKRIGIQDSDRGTTMMLAQELYKQGKFDRETFDIFKNIRELRNKVVHARVTDLTEFQALEYESITRRLVSAFEKM